MALLLVTHGGTMAQEAFKGQITVAAEELSQRGDLLYVKLSIDVSGGNVEAQRTLDLVPVISNGDRQLELPAVTIAGKSQYKAYQRSLRLSGGIPGEVERYAVLPTGNRDRVLYDYALPYEPWMETGFLELKQDLCGCGRYIRQVEVKRLVDNISLEKKIILTPYQITPELAYVRPETEAVKQRAETKEAHLIFASGQTVIRPEMGNNTAELATIRSFIGEVNTDKNVTIRQISITGYASPEGSLALNKRLSEGRALALRDYLQQHYSISRNLYSIHFGGEDWEGLVKLLAQSIMAYKQEVLDIIHSVSIEGGREGQIMRLRGGEPYRYMLANLFPSLRRVIVTADYEVRQFSLGEAKEVFAVRPQNLSLNEMFLVANTYDKGSKEFNEVFETAVRMFPRDKVANLNAAASALGRQDMVTAERYLQQTDTTLPEYLNNMGVLLLMQEKYEQARDYFERAKARGVVQATDNLAELEKKLENIRQMEP